MVVVVSGMPEATDSLEALAALDGTLAQTVRVGDMQQRASNAEYTIGLRVPLERVGQQISVGVAAYDAHGCVLAVGDHENSIPVQPDSSGFQRLRVSLVAVEHECSPARPLFLKSNPTQRSTSGTNLIGTLEPLSIIGLGLDAQTAVLVNGKPATVNWLSPIRITASVPPQPGNLGNAIVTLRNHLGDISRSDILTLYAAQVDFGAGRAIALGDDTTALSLAAADFNQDGYADLVVSTSRLLGGAGTKSFQIDMYVGSQNGFSAAPKVLDNASQNPLIAPVNLFDSPNHPLGVLLWGQSSESVNLMQLGNENSPFDYGRVKADAGILAVADMDGDGAPDLLESDGVNQAKILWTGITTSTVISLGMKPCGGAVKDLNHDRKFDVILSHAQGISIALASDFGSFLPLGKYTSTAGCGPLVVADVNGDGNADIETASSALPAQLAIFLGHGDGSFQPAVQTDLAAPIAAIAVADFNSDLRDDLILNGGPSSAPATTVLISKGDGSFFPPERFPGLGVAIGNSVNDASKTAIADDFNGDKSPDLALLFGSNLLVFTGNGTGSFARSIDTDLGKPVGSFILADVNADALLDLVSTHDDSLEIGISLGRTGGHFAAPDFYSMPSLPYPPGMKMQVLATDLNRDGKLDLYVLTSLWDQVSLIGDGVGRFRRDSSVPGPGSAANLQQEADFDEDHMLDGVGVFEQTMNVWYASLSTPSAELLSAESTLGIPHVSDLNGDHHLDVLVASLTTIYVFMGEGAPTGKLHQIAHYTSLPPSSSPFKLILGDYNGDHKPDVLVTGDRARVLLLGNGDGTFIEGQPISTSGEALGTAADTNGDGISDAILLANGVINVLLGSPSGELILGARLGAAALYASPSGLAPDQIAAFDFDGNGMPDIIVPSALNGQLSVLLNSSR